jgi:hypothetical protein
VLVLVVLEFEVLVEFVPPAFVEAEELDKLDEPVEVLVLVESVEDEELDVAEPLDVPDELELPELPLAVEPLIPVPELEATLEFVVVLLPEFVLLELVSPGATAAPLQPAEAMSNTHHVKRIFRLIMGSLIGE